MSKRAACASSGGSAFRAACQCGLPPTGTGALTGVEMEALTAVTVAALTIYDMCKAVDKAMVIRDVRLLKKTKQAL